jgi:hypothetical protein
MYRNHVWSYDFVEARTYDGRSLRLLVLIDEYTRECLAIPTKRLPISYVKSPSRPLPLRPLA